MNRVWDNEKTGNLPMDLRRPERERQIRKQTVKHAIRKRSGLSALALVILLSMLLSGCGFVYVDDSRQEESTAQGGLTVVEGSSAEQNSDGKKQDTTGASGDNVDASGDEAAYLSWETFCWADVPAFPGRPYLYINEGVPFFTEEEIEDAENEYYEYYSPLDELGRCGYAMASIDTALMPTEERGDIYWIHPTGWQKESGYERSHLIAFQLCGENDNEKNLITGTHYLNGIGMLPFEEMVGDYVRETDTRVLYRVTPIFEEEEMVARGVLMEAYSLADGGEDICFCVFVYNVVEPSEGKLIDYSTGKVYEGQLEIDTTAQEAVTYIVNRNSHIFHYPDCDGAQSMSEKNKIYFEGTREEALKAGYTPCPNCQP
ncbi:MAG: DNA/RNA non-specific endonuclease [Lachnospiraceae bacterium]|nr:DNA/RNA non-specific endonuclease [Lachnospiraceae bacterium]